VAANSASGSEGHFGLVGITERTKRLDGKFTIKSAPGAGTCLLVEIPIASAAPTKDAQSNNGSADA
jgi:signal transduction histidine kinase